MQTNQKLQIYLDLLHKWQSSINLISAKTLSTARVRHFDDSAQIVPYISDSIQVVCDLGSGAGFPGLVLAILRPDLQVHLVESDERKAQFLRTVSRETETPVQVHNERIESVYDAIQPDLITARALADLTKLCGLVLPWAQDNPVLEMLFLKGRSADEELAQAQTNFDFDYERYQSQTEPEASILHLSRLSSL